MTTVASATLPRDEGPAWQRKADAVWARAKGDLHYWRRHAPPLPAWSASACVTRPLMGHWLLDRDTGVVHDARHATDACDLDGIANGTWVHFAAELQMLHPDVQLCAGCGGG